MAWLPVVIGRCGDWSDPVQLQWLHPGVQHGPCPEHPRGSTKPSLEFTKSHLFAKVNI